MILWRLQELQYTHLYFSTSGKPSEALLQTNYTLCEVLLRKNMWGNGQGRQQAHFTSSEFKSISARRPVFQSSVWFCSSCSTWLAVYCSATTKKRGGWAADEVLGRDCTTKGLVCENKKGVRKQLFARFAQNGSLQGEWAILVLKIKGVQCTEVGPAFSQLAEKSFWRATGHLASTGMGFLRCPCQLPCHCSRWQHGL